MLTNEPRQYLREDLRKDERKDELMTRAKNRVKPGAKSVASGEVRPTAQPTASSPTTSSPITPSPITPSKPPATWPMLSGRKLTGVFCALLGVVTVVLYSRVLGNRFVVWDDHEYVTGNPHIRSGLSWSTFKWAFTTYTAANWHPLTWLSHALDCQLFALHPAGHHLDSVLIHAINVVLVFLLLVWTTKRIAPSLLVAALFSVHPLNVQSVAWVAERKNVLSTMFFLLAIGAYVRYAQKPDWQRYLPVAALFAAGLMAKPMVITLPFVLLLLDYWPLQRVEASPASAVGAPKFSISRLTLEKIPLFALSAASAWITLVAQRSGYAVRNFEEFSFGARLENALVAYGLYLWKMIWPARLAVLYPHPANALPVWQVMLSTFVLLGISAFVLVFHNKRYLTVGWFWFLGTLVPVLGLVQVGEAAMADRYAYIPLIGIFIAVAWSLDEWADARHIPLRWHATAAVCVLVVLASVTFSQIGVWESEYSLWAHAADVTENNPYAQALAGKALLSPDDSMSPNDLKGFDTEQKRISAARQYLEEALRLYKSLVQKSPDAYLPDMAATLGNLGNVAGFQNRPDEARQDYEDALRYYRRVALRNPEPHLLNIATNLNNLANADRRLNRMDDASNNYEEALNIYRQMDGQEPGAYQKDIVNTLINLGTIEDALGQTEKANSHFEEALQIGRQLARQNPNAYLPNLANRLNNFATFERDHNRLAEARAHYEEALKIYQQLAQQNSGSARAVTSQNASPQNVNTQNSNPQNWNPQNVNAQNVNRSPSQWSPAMVTTLTNLGALDMVENRRDDARREFESALDLNRQLAQQDPNHFLPELAWSLNNLGRLDGLQNQIDEARGHFEEALEIYHRLAQRDAQIDPRFSPDFSRELAETLNSLAIIARQQKRQDASRSYDTEALSIYRVLAQRDPARYKNDVARVEASLGETAH